ncbi:tetratricopeptide repeat protein [Luteolibacter pohnpeiensis]|uniref:Tetratricopeptide repeat protein n=1 Tax=Luteolibacter pohnpeiensis TaxID=454153 RepID=A0A934VWC9_9BACT|nr:tetratricopeptide repeat protein [Luteolibacter pohnpeiensis]MBK1882364.1 tetratricopeptide repeat protein [Luteolibacter pohnpeiensis]
MDSSTANLIAMLRERIDSLRNAGNLEEAVHAASAAVEKCQQSLGPDLEHIDAFATALEIRAEIQRELGNLDSARDDYRQAIDQLDQRPDRMDQLGRLYAGLGAAQDALGEPDRAAVAWERAIGFFEKVEPPLLLDVAALRNNLGFLKKADGNLDDAESHFLRSLEILHGVHGNEHEETASVSNNLGALYQSAGFFEQAREMHMMALEARRALLGEEHPDTAQSHNNLALALLSTGDRSWARRHFEKALSGFESLGSDYAADLEAVAENYCDFLRSEGESTLAEVIAGRVREVLGTNQTVPA